MMQTAAERRRLKNEAARRSLAQARRKSKQRSNVLCIQCREKTIPMIAMKAGDPYCSSECAYRAHGIEQHDYSLFRDLKKVTVKPSPLVAWRDTAEGRIAILNGAKAKGSVALKAQAKASARAAMERVRQEALKQSQSTVRRTWPKTTTGFG